jgi:hypothetical protein
MQGLPRDSPRRVYSSAAPGGAGVARMTSPEKATVAEGFHMHSLSAGQQPQGIEVEVAADSVSRLVPGGSVTVRVAAGAVRGIVVPETALVPGIGRDRVYVASGKGAYSPREVTVAACVVVQVAQGALDGPWGFPANRRGRNEGHDLGPARTQREYGCQGPLDLPRLHTSRWVTRPCLRLQGWRRSALRRGLRW